MPHRETPTVLRFMCLYVMVFALAACGGSSDGIGEIVEPDDPTDLLVEWPSVCDQAFGLAENGVVAGQDSPTVAEGIVASAKPLFVECTTAVVATYPISCLDVVTTMSAMLDSATQTDAVGGSKLILRRSDALIQCDIDHVHDVAEQ